MQPDLATAIQFTQWLLSAGILLQGIESLVARRVFGSAGLFVLRIAICLWLLSPAGGLSSWANASAHLALLVTSMWLVVRVRGPLCGGSDAMWFQVQLGLLLASLEFLHPNLPKIGLGWIAAQSVLSYLLAGVAKLRNPRWRNGSALHSLLQSEGPYVLWEPMRALANHPSLCAVLAWGLMLFEVCFALVLVVPSNAAVALVGLGFAFHLANAAALGLNRFVWAWAATYPALLYF